MDMNYEEPVLNLHKEKITAENINFLLDKYNTPYQFDLLSIDIDYNDFHVWNAIDDKYQPRVVVIEYNSSLLPYEDKVVLYNPDFAWDRTNYFGASILSFYKLGKKKGYSLVYAESKGVNLFFIRDDVLNVSDSTFKDVNCVEKIYKKPRYGCAPDGGHPADLLNRQYLPSDHFL